MIRLTKLADYGVVVLSHMAAEPRRMFSAAELANEVHVAVPTVSKVLKVLARRGILESHRGANGGYTLGRPAESISVAEVIAAMEGPIAVTECIEDGPGECAQESFCGVRGPWQRINDAIRTALEGISLAEMAQASEASRDPLVRIGSDLQSLSHRGA